MIIHCPSCSSRLDIPNLVPGSGGMMVDCPVCHHDWIEGSAMAVAPEPVVQTAVADEPAPLAESDTRRMLEAARTAQKEFTAAQRRRRALAAAWLGLAVIASAPPVIALMYPEPVVAAIPASIVLYDWAGRDVNIYGVAIREVELQHVVVDGKKVIAIKGELANISRAPRKIPALRFGLLSAEGAEVYHWTLDASARPLGPGESTAFMTRLASPPESARNLQIRFARADEIGSNAGHE